MTESFLQAFTERRGRLMRRLASLGLDALIVSCPPNVRYLTGFTGSAALLVAGPASFRFITDSRYLVSAGALLASQSGEQRPELEPVQRTYDETLASTMPSGVRRIGFEADRVPFNQALRWASVLGASMSAQTSVGGGGAAGRRLIPTTGVVEAARAVKDPVELAALREAARRVSLVASEVLSALEPGPSEREVAALIDTRVREMGLSGPGFDTIVASGQATALPHATPGDRALARGDLVLVDFGGALDGYCADLTRTVVLGEPDHECARAYSAVREAVEAAEAAAVVGSRASAVDGAARELLARLAPDGVYEHGTGHGLGLEVHEAPRIGRVRSSGGAGSPGPVEDAELVAGQVFTIEPGVYRPGWGGIRIEDDFVLTAQGLERLTLVPRLLNFD